MESNKGKFLETSKETTRLDTKTKPPTQKCEMTVQKRVTRFTNRLKIDSQLTNEAINALTSVNCLSIDQLQIIFRKYFQK